MSPGLTAIFCKLNQPQRIKYQQLGKRLVRQHMHPYQADSNAGVRQQI
jgi:hypothetical protein